MKFPAALSFLNHSTPFEMSSSVPPLAREVMNRPLRPAEAFVGSPLRATTPLNFGSNKSSSFVIVPSAPSYPIVKTPV